MQSNDEGSLVGREGDGRNEELSVNKRSFWTEDGTAVPAVTMTQMREVDRIAVEDFGLGILQMMENAGRNLALQAIDMLGEADGEIAVFEPVHGGESHGDSGS